MADKQVNINVTAKADKSEIEDLVQSFDNLKSSSEEATNTVEDFKTSVENVDGTGFDETSSSAEDTASSVDDATTSTEGFNDANQNVNGDGFGDVANQAGNASEEVDNTTNSALNLVEAMASAAVASTITSGIGDMVSAAGSYEDTMVRLGYAMSGTSMSAEQAQQQFGGAISRMADETGRGVGVIRQHILNLGNAGIKNQKVLEDSFNGISKAAFQMGTDIGQADAIFQRMVISGSIRAPTLANAFGLSMKDLANAMGVSADEVSDKFKQMDADSRAAVLSSALNMKYGADVTENYKNSYEHLTEEVDRAKDYLIRSVGEAVLPYVIPAMQTAADVINGVTGAFRSLPEPLQNMIGIFVSGVGGVMGFAFALSSVIKFAQFVYSPINKLASLFGVDLDKALKNAATGLKNFAKELAINVINSIKSAISWLNNLVRTLVSGLVNAARNAVVALAELAKNVLLAGLNALKSAAMWAVEKAALIASTIAEKAAAAAQWLLNIAMNANPIMLIVTAIGLLIMALAYLYFNNEQVRNALNQFGAAFKYVGQIIYGLFIMQIQLLVSALQMAWSYISTLPDRILQTMTNIAATVIAGITNMLAFISSIPGRIGAYLSQVISRAISFASNFVTQLWNAGKNALTRFIDNIKQIPVRLGQELSNALNKVNEWAATLPAKFWEAGVNAVKNFLSALGIASPGTMQRMLVWEVTEMGKKVPEKGKQVISNISKLGSDIVDGFGNPRLSMDFDDNLNANVNANNRLLDDNKQQHGDLILNLSVGTVDKRERIDEIVSIIRDEIYWDNTTAGRSV